MRPFNRVLKKSLSDFFGVGLLVAALRNPHKSFAIFRLGLERRRRGAPAGCVFGAFQQPARAWVLTAAVLAASGSACGYRFLEADGPRDISLASVRNASPEPLLAPALTDALDRVAGLRPGAGRPLDVVVTEFGEGVGSIDSSGRPLRQDVTIQVSWRLGGDGGREARFGRETVARSYPVDAGGLAFSWTRQAAIRLLCEDAARALADRLAELP